MTETRAAMPVPKIATKEAIDRAEEELKRRGPKSAEEIAEMVEDMKANQQQVKRKS